MEQDLRNCWHWGSCLLRATRLLMLNVCRWVSSLNVCRWVSSLCLPTFLVYIFEIIHSLYQFYLYPKIFGRFWCGSDCPFWKLRLLFFSFGSAVNEYCFCCCWQKAASITELYIGNNQIANIREIFHLKVRNATRFV